MASAPEEILVKLCEGYQDDIPKGAPACLPGMDASLVSAFQRILSIPDQTDEEVNLKQPIDPNLKAWLARIQKLIDQD